MLTVRAMLNPLQTRDGPVQFEKDADPFNIDELIKDATSGSASGTKRYGMQDAGDTRSLKRARMEDDDIQDTGQREAL